MLTKEQKKGQRKNKREQCTKEKYFNQLKMQPLRTKLYKKIISFEPKIFYLRKRLSILCREFC